MPSKSSRTSKPKTVETALITTNFRQIKGINQLSEARLHRAGIKTFDELASLQPAEILEALGNPKGITVKQIVEQDWIGQAGKLAGKKPIANGTIESEGFIVNLFLSKKKQVHSTQILHVNSDEGDKWDGWDSQRLLDFITKRASIVLPLVEVHQDRSLLVEIAQESAAAIYRSGEAEKLASPLQSAEAIVMPLSEPLHPLAPPVAETFLSEFEILPLHSAAPGKLLRIGEPFEVRFSLNAEKLPTPFTTALDFTAALIAKGIDAPQPIHLREVQGVLNSPNEAIVVNIPKQNFKPGTYRLEAALTIGKGAQTLGQPMRAHTIFQVF
jgi:hypothetical protein